MADRRVPRELRERLIRENIEASVAIGMPEHEARKIAEEVFKEAVQRAQASGAIDIPPGAGDRALARKDTDPESRALYQLCQAEGVTDEDIRSYYNMSSIEEHMLFVQDEIARTSVIAYHADQGRTEEEQLDITRKALPIYGDTDETPDLRGDDRPLRPELRFRVMTLVEEGMANPEDFRRRVESHSSFNAFVRAEMRAGRFPATDPNRPSAAVSPSVPSQSKAGPGCLLSLFAMCWQALKGR